MSVVVRLADLNDPSDAAAVLEMTRAYAMDPMARGEDLPDDIKGRLVDELREHPAAFIYLACDESEAVGIATCFMSFSTFRAKKLVNLHDICVKPRMRGKGVSRALLRAVEEHARRHDCAGVTLEVYARNGHARDVYKSMGFSGARDSEEDATYFCFKELA